MVHTHTHTHTHNWPRLIGLIDSGLEKYFLPLFRRQITMAERIRIKTYDFRIAKHRVSKT